MERVDEMDANNAYNKYRQPRYAGQLETLIHHEIRWSNGVGVVNNHPIIIQLTGGHFPENLTPS